MLGADDGQKNYVSCLVAMMFFLICNFFLSIICGHIEGGSHGSWESGLSYECRSLLFKALHNLIER